MKTLYIKAVISIVSLLALNYSHAQTEPQFSNYMYNVQQFNPAMAGEITEAELTGFFRSQWTGLDGAPESQWLSFGMPISNDRMGVGLNLVNDKIGPASYKSFSLVYAYRIMLSETTTLSLGVNAGGSVLDVDFTMGNFENFNDVSQNNLNNEFYARVGAGAIISATDWFVGFSVPNFFGQDFYDDEVRNVIADKIQFNLFTGYNMDLSSSLRLRPSLLANIVEGNPVTLTGNANLLILDRFSIGLGYRYDEAVTGFLGFQILEGLLAGYTYDYATNDFGEFHNGSHEIVLKYKINKSAYKSRRLLNSY